ncbi:MAG: hypothetical protein ABI863_11195 [Ginsengibacter sp.]
MKKLINLPRFRLPRISRYITAPAQKMYTGDSVELKKGIYKVLGHSNRLKKSISYPV